MGSNRKLILIVGLGSALLGVVATLVFQDGSQKTNQAKSLQRKNDSWAPPKPMWVKTPDSTANKQEVASGERRSERDVGNSPKPTLENPPAVTQVRDETAQNPHTTAQALLAFAEEMSIQMQGAFSDRETRYTVSRQLIACARDGQAKGSAQAARALCLFNLERLKERFPDELSPSYQSLLAELPEDLIFVAGVTKPNVEK
ncbi:hypothetical protein EBR21_00850 [bacterium]|nr:hypothetical protein [bacterium]